MRASVRRTELETEEEKVSTGFQSCVLKALEHTYETDKAAYTEMRISKSEFSKLKRSGRWGELLDRLSDTFWQELTTLLAESKGMEVRYTSHQIERQGLVVIQETQKWLQMLAVSRGRRATDNDRR